jgi:hypothetical protein
VNTAIANPFAGMAVNPRIPLKRLSRTPREFAF